VAILAKLTAGQSKVYSAVQGAVARGLGLNATQDLLHATGMGIRREQISQLVNYFSGVTQAGYDVSKVRHDYFPDVAKFPSALTTLRREYSYTVRLGKTGEFDELNRPVYSYVTVTTDKPMTIQGILDEAESYYDEIPENYQLGEGEDFEPVVVGAKRQS